MSRQATWEISREMFLAEDEVEGLLRHVRKGTTAAAVHQRDSVRLDSARLDRLIVELLLFSGLRNSELCRLTVGDLVGAGSEPALTIRQGGKLDRMVHVPAAIGRLIDDFRQTTRRRYLPPGVDPDDPTQTLVFHERRRPFERTGLYRRVVRILTAAGLENRASVQLLRHTYGYLAYLRTGGNLLFTQRQLGHAHPMVTAIYAQLVPESYSALAEKTAGEMRGKGEEAKRGDATSVV
ncbi:MAG TPA: site-specific integrase [Pirellulales bacterium]|jgi:integrase|nr:site-specific integrase [Pirellulales bacterium]